LSSHATPARRSYDEAVTDLAAKADPDRFVDTFGAPVSELQVGDPNHKAPIHNPHC
jgi:hypothetical protein